MKIETFDTLSAFARSLRNRLDGNPKAKSRVNRWTKQGGHDWAAGVTLAQALKMAKDGDVSIVEKAKAMAKQIRANINTRGLEPVWQHAVAGAFPCVPTYLSGEPENMVQCTPMVTDTAPVNVYYCGQLMSNHTQGQLVERAAAIFAAIRALQAIRPVNMYMVSAFPEPITNLIVKVRTNPMVMSEAAFMVGHPAYVRMLTYGWAMTYGWHGNRVGWADDYLPEEKVEASMRDKFGVGNPDDLFIPPFRPVHLKDPVKWINGLLDQYRR